FLSYAVVFVMLFLTGILGFYGIRIISDKFTSVVQKDAALLNQVTFIQKSVLNLRRYEKDILINISSSESVASYKTKWDSEVKNVSEQLNASYKLIEGFENQSQIKANLLSINKNFETYSGGFNSLYDKIREKILLDSLEVNKEMKPFKEATYQLEKEVDEVYNYLILKAQNNEKEVNGLTYKLSTMLILITFFSAVLVLFFSLIIFRSINNPLSHLLSIFEDISEKSNLQLRVKVYTNDEIGNVSKAVNRMLDSLEKIYTDIIHLTENATEGKLSYRADEEQYDGDYKKMIAGMNRLLDSVVEPLKLAASYIENISKGNLPEKIVQEYRGDFNTLKDNINTLVYNLSTFIIEIKTMAKEKRKGNIDYSIPEKIFSGAYLEMAQGVNSMVKE
ncbi:MAG: HAMP domain-containing protein, partial [Leptospiraceae bacterium]|nr:HAMP domain-containing protein [Leptospiraceae bacterium]